MIKYIILKAITLIRASVNNNSALATTIATTIYLCRYYCILLCSLTVIRDFIQRVNCINIFFFLLEVLVSCE
jgi:hypothetical protein